MSTEPENPPAPDHADAKDAPAPAETPPPPAAPPEDAPASPAEAAEPAKVYDDFEGPPEPPPAPLVPKRKGIKGVYDTIVTWVRDYFQGDDPTFTVALVPLCFLSMILFTRHPKTNFIFDEQEALLANPYVRSVADHKSKLHWIDAFHRDFWGLPPDRSIGSYRPIPDLVWRVLWFLGARDQTAFVHHWVNVLLHGTNGAILTFFVFRMTKKKETAWLCGAAFTASAVITEAVSGVVGIADVLGGTGCLLALLALTYDLPWMILIAFGGSMFGLLSKETAMVLVPLLPATALLTSQLTHPERPRRWLRASVAFAVTAIAFVLYVEGRRRLFPAPLPHDLTIEANADKPPVKRAFMTVLRWYAQPMLPHDVLNNPLVTATPPQRIAGGLRVYFRGLVQVFAPWTLSGDYSAPQEPVPDNLFAPEIVAGFALLVAPIVAAAWLGISAYRRCKKNAAEGMLDFRPIVAAGLLWIVLSYFPVSNIPVVLPTVRAERFWYFPVIGSALMMGVILSALRAKYTHGRPRQAVIALFVVFFGLQCVAARRHANDYKDDLTFWDATRKAVPNSAKAHLNYSVMKGARGDLEARLVSSRRALELAPQWPMASIYLGDTLCRLHRAQEAWPEYVRGFDLAPNDTNLIALALQCLWDEKMFEKGNPIRTELEQADQRHVGSWLAYLGQDILEHGEDHNGVDPKYRPRGYNEGPKE